MAYKSGSKPVKGGLEFIFRSRSACHDANRIPEEKNALKEKGKKLLAEYFGLESLFHTKPAPVPTAKHCFYINRFFNDNHGCC